MVHTTENKNDHVLIIKLGALGDFVQAIGPFRSIRFHHPNARLTLLTTASFSELARKSGIFEDVWVDEKPKKWEVIKWLKLRTRLRKANFNRVYDLQTSNRSSLYFHLLLPGSRPEWSGIAAGCSHPHKNLQRDNMHTIERQAEQLSIAGITDVVLDNLNWFNSDISKFNLPKNYALVAPGGSIRRPAKQWPVKYFSKLSKMLINFGIYPVLIGTKIDQSTIAKIHHNCPDAINLCEKTSLHELFALAYSAKFSIGNDTGPMHISAVAGNFCLVLFSDASDPKLCAPRGKKVKILHKPDLNNLNVSQVIREIKKIISF